MIRRKLKAVKKDVFPAGYTKLNYLRSTGTQWIRTDLLFTNDLRLEAKIDTTNVLNNYSYFFGNAFGFYSYFGSIRDATQFIYYRGNSSTTASAFKGILNIVITETVNGSSSIIINNSITCTANNIEDSAPSRYFCIFGAEYGAGVNAISIMDFYNMKIIKDGQTIRHFVPAKRKSDNALGIIDLVGGNFFTNNGTGNFIEG